jgi:hypothetical protein
MIIWFRKRRKMVYIMLKWVSALCGRVSKHFPYGTSRFLVGHLAFESATKSRKYSLENMSWMPDNYRPTPRQWCVVPGKLCKL